MFRKLESKKKKVNQIKGIDSVLSKPEIAEGAYSKCLNCDKIHDRIDLAKNLWVCDACGYHYRMHVVERIIATFDEFKVFNHIVKSKDPLAFPGYQEKLDSLSESLGVYDAVVCGEAKIGEHSVIAVVMDPNFMMGSMGSVVGEKVTRSVERAMKQKKPMIIFSASGGARMQEGLVSLMQMAKTSGAVGKFHEHGGLFINVLTDPTTGGVTASFAMLGDIILAEPGALIGFAGPRVIEQTMKKALPEGFQRAEFLLEKGFVDAIVERKNLKSILSQILKIHEVK